MNCKEKLTAKLPRDGNFAPKGYCTYKKNGDVFDCSNCDEICNENENCDNCYIQKCFNKLGELEDKLENGTLIELPCKVGDEIYYIPSFVSRPQVLLGTIIAIRIEKSGYGVQIQETPHNGYYNKTALGIDWFLTKEKAEARLKELQNG